MTLAEKYANEYTGYEHNHSWTIVQHGFNAGYDHGKEERTKLVTQLDICRESLASAVKENERYAQYKPIYNQRISEQVQQLDERDASIKNLININGKLNEEIKSLHEIIKELRLKLSEWIVED